MRLVCIFILLILISAADSQIREIHDSTSDNSTAETHPRPSDDVPNIKAVLEDMLIKRIKNAERINIFRIKEFVTTNKQQTLSRRFFADYEIVKSSKLNRKRIKAVKVAFLQAKNYMSPEFVNKCPFAATVGWEFKTKNDSLRIIMSYPCKTVLFLDNGKEYYRDLYSLKLFDQIAKSYFKDIPTTD